MEALKAEHGLDLAEIFTDEEQLLASPNIQAVMIETPDRFHASSMLKAAKYGKHALVEKPLANTIEEFTKIEEALKIFKEK